MKNICNAVLSWLLWLAGNTAPNPLVGSIVVHNNIIIGEGYHERYGRHMPK
ncbi:MAG: hypothetical protein R2847_09005 [Bacteroidia bacterium]